MFCLALGLMASPAVTYASSHLSEGDRLYSPVAEFNRTTSKADRTQMKAALRAFTIQVDACQKPYAKHLFYGPVNSNEQKLHTLYEEGTLLEQYQRIEAPVKAQLRLAEASWATMRLANPTLQNYARAQATELYASLIAPTVDACAFLTQLAQHKFSLAWARRSLYGRLTRDFWAQLSMAADIEGKEWPIIERGNLLTKRQLSGLINFPGILS